MSINMFEKFGKTFNPNQIIFSEHEPGNDFYLLQAGKVKITKIVGETEKTLDVLKPGDIFGEMAIIEEAPRSATAIAIGDVKTLHFNKGNFESLLRSQPALALRLLKIFASRIYDAKRKLMILSLEENDAKVADALLMLAEKKGFTKETYEPIEIETTIVDVAHWCGLQVEQCQAILTQFVNMNRITIGQNTITIKNINEISRYVQQKRKHEDY